MNRYFIALMMISFTATIYSMEEQKKQPSSPLSPAIRRIQEESNRKCDGVHPSQLKRQNTREMIRTQPTIKVKN